MEKLELKYLASYLPHNLRLLSNEGVIYKVHGFCKDSLLTWVDDGLTTNEYYHTAFYAMKPILRPLSDLTKEIEHNGEKFVPKEVLDETHVSNWSYGNIKNVNTEMFQEAPFWWTTKLYEWHFDIHGLIEKGLAIDINTLNK